MTTYKITTCDICKKDITKAKSERELNISTFTISYPLFDSTVYPSGHVNSEDLDMCERCDSEFRRWRKAMEPR